MSDENIDREFVEENENRIAPSMEYSVRLYQPDDEKEIVSLLDEAFNVWPKLDINCSTLDYWRWKHLPGMAFDNTVAVGVNKKNEIVGCCHSTIYEGKTGDEKALLQQGVDLAVHKDYRRKGMMGKMRALLPMNYIRYNSTSNPIVKNESKIKTSLSFPKPIYIYMKINDLNLYKKTKKKTSEFQLLGYRIFEKMDRMRKNSTEVNHRVKKSMNFLIV